MQQHVKSFYSIILHTFNVARSLLSFSQILFPLILFSFIGTEALLGVERSDTVINCIGFSRVRPFFALLGLFVMENAVGLALPLAKAPSSFQKTWNTENQIFFFTRAQKVWEAFHDKSSFLIFLAECFEVVGGWQLFLKAKVLHLL